MTTGIHSTAAVLDAAHSMQHGWELRDVTVRIPMPDGWESTHEYRQPEIGEHVLGILKDGTWQAVEVSARDADYQTGRRAFILRKQWEAPKCFPVGWWLYQSASDNHPVPAGWYLSRLEPSPAADGYSVVSGSHPPHDAILAEHFARLHNEAFEPPIQQIIQVKR